MRTSYRMHFFVRHGLQNALFRRVRFSSPGQTSTHLTKKRTLAQPPHAKVHSGSDPSRKSALCPDGLTRKRILGPTPHEKAHFVSTPSRGSALWPRPLTQKRIPPRRPHAKAHSGGSEDPRARLSVRTSYRMRFSVTHRLQNALFRRVRFSSPGQTSTHLTQKRILHWCPHGKPHSGLDLSRKSALCVDSSRKSALCPDGLTQKHTPRDWHDAECAFW